MAQVTWTIQAIDKTRAAFASINQNLRGFKRESDSVGKRLTAGLIGGGAFALLGREIRDVARDIENIKGVPPDVVQSIKDMTAALTETRDTGRRLIADWLGTFATAAKSIGSTLGAINWLDFINPMKTGAAIGEAQSRVVVALNDETQKYIETLKAQQKAELDQARATKEAKAALEEKTRIEKLGRAGADDALKQMERQRKMSEDYIKGLNAEGETIRQSVLTPTEKYAEELDRLNFLRDSGAVSVDTYNRKVKEMNASLEEMPKILKESSKTTTELGWAFSSAFEDAIISGGKLRDVLRGLLQDIARIIIRNTITTPIANAITGGLNSAFGIGGTTSTSSTPARAAGGPVASGTTYLVGENGPELFTPSTAGNIIPNHKLNQGSSAGGSTFSFVYNIASGVTRNELMPLLKQSQDTTIARINDARARRSASLAYA